MVKKDYSNMCRVIMDMAALTASAQLRSAGRFGSSTPEDLMLFGSDKKWQSSVIAYATRYVPVFKGDFENYKKDFKSGIPTPAYLETAIG